MTSFPQMSAIGFSEELSAPLRQDVPWTILIPVCMGAIGIYLLLPQPRKLRSVGGALTASAALILGGWLLTWSTGLKLEESVLFYAFSGIAVAAGCLLITQRNPVHAALSFALVVLSTCGLFLLQAAPFLMAATTIVYAGAIVVTFLFVIMLAQQAGLSDADHRSREPFLATTAGFVLLACLLFILHTTYDSRELTDLVGRAEAAAEEETPAGIMAKLGDDTRFLADFHRAAASVRGSSDAASLDAEVAEIRADWEEWKRAEDISSMRKAVDLLAKKGAVVRDTYGMLRRHDPVFEKMSASIPPADQPGPSENVAPLGLMLFTDYLVAVELAGTLLLVATIGAIAISSRKTESLR